MPSVFLVVVVSLWYCHFNFRVFIWSPFPTGYRALKLLSLTHQLGNELDVDTCVVFLCCVYNGTVKKLVHDVPQHFSLCLVEQIVPGC